MVVPALPYLFDQPVEEAVDWCFGTALRMYGGEDAVRPLPHHGIGKIAEEKSVSAAAQVSWEEYKNEREKARETRREENGSSSPSSWFGLSGSKEKKE